MRLAADSRRAETPHRRGHRSLAGQFRERGPRHCGRGCWIARPGPEPFGRDRRVRNADGGAFGSLVV